MKVKINHFNTTLMSILVILGLACKTTKITKSNDKMEVPNLSQVNIPMTLEIKELEAIINNQIDGVLFENGDLTDDSTGDLKIRAEKTKDISIAFDSSRINYIVPLKLWFKKGLSFMAFEAEGEIALNLSTVYTIEKDWQLTTQTTIVDFEWLEKPRLRMGLIDLSIKYIANVILERSKVLICSALDEEFAKRFNLQDYVNEAWETLQSPILASEEFDLWVSIFPEKVGMTPVVSDGRRIKSTIMVQTSANALVGEKIQTEKMLPLPPFYLSADNTEAFHLHLKTEITYAEAEKIAQKYVVGETFTSGKRSVKVEDIKLHPKGDKIAVDAKLAGSYNGVLHLVGKPVFNPKKNEIEIKDLDYELATRNFLIKSFNWIFQRGIEKRLKKLMKFELDENLNEIANLLDEKLENYEISEGIFLNGNLSKLDVGGIQLDENGFVITIISTGKLNLFINKIIIP